MLCIEYISPSGKPAEYSIEKYSIQTKHHLPIQLDGVENGDYTMIFGYPGSTDRYLTFCIKQALDISNPTIVDIRSEKLAIMKAGMDTTLRQKYSMHQNMLEPQTIGSIILDNQKGLEQ